MDLFNRVFYSKDSKFKPWVDNIIGLGVTTKILNNVYIENSLDYTHSPNYFWKNNTVISDGININFNQSYLLRQRVNNFNPRLSILFHF